MKTVAVIIATAASIGSAYFVGTNYSNQAVTIRENLCLTDRTIVQTLESNLEETTKSDLKHFGISNQRWERLREQAIARIYAFRDAAPCAITVKIPPDIINKEAK